MPTVLVSALLLTGMLAAAPPPAEPNPRQMIETLRMWRLTSELGLSDEQSMKFFPRVRELREGRLDYQSRRRQLIEELARLLTTGRPAVAVLKVKLAALERLDLDWRAREDVLRREIAGILTVEQQARFWVFQERFDTEIRDLIRDVRQRRLKGGSQ